MIPCRVTEAGGVFTVDDFVRFHFVGAWQRRRYRMLMFLLVPGWLFSAVNLFWVVTPARVSPGDWFRYCGLLAFVLYLFAAPWLVGRRKAKASPLLAGPVHFHFGDDEIAFEGAGFNSAVRWSLVDRIVETRTMFLVYIGSPIAWMLPKRFLTTNGNCIDEWREFASSRLRSPKSLRRAPFLVSWL